MLRKEYNDFNKKINTQKITVIANIIENLTFLTVHEKKSCSKQISVKLSNKKS